MDTNIYKPSSKLRSNREKTKNTACTNATKCQRGGRICWPKASQRFAKIIVVQFFFGNPLEGQRPQWHISRFCGQFRLYILKSANVLRMTGKVPRTARVDAKFVCEFESVGKVCPCQHSLLNHMVGASSPGQHEKTGSTKLPPLSQKKGNCQGHGQPWSIYDLTPFTHARSNKKFKWKPKLALGRWVLKVCQHRLRRLNRCAYICFKYDTCTTIYVYLYV